MHKANDREKTLDLWQETQCMALLTVKLNHQSSLCLTFRWQANLLHPPADLTDDVSSSWVPLNVCGHQMFSDIHQCHVWRVVELQYTVWPVVKMNQTINHETSRCLFNRTNSTSCRWCTTPKRGQMWTSWLKKYLIYKSLTYHRGG